MRATKASTFDPRDPVHVAEFGAYLASPERGWISGQTFQVRGGIVEHVETWTVGQRRSRATNAGFTADDYAREMPRLFGAGAKRADPPPAEWRRDTGGRGSAGAAAGIACSDASELRHATRISSSTRSRPYRMTRLIVSDGIVEKQRHAVVERLRRRGHNKLVELTECPWCIGFWVAAGVVAARRLVAAFVEPGRRRLRVLRGVRTARVASASTRRRARRHATGDARLAGDRRRRDRRRRARRDARACRGSTRLARGDGRYSDFFDLSASFDLRLPSAPSSRPFLNSRCAEPSPRASFGS